MSYITLLEEEYKARVHSKVRHEILEQICGEGYRKCLIGGRAENPDGRIYVIRIYDNEVKVSFPGIQAERVFSLSDPDFIEKAQIFITNPGS